MDTKYAKYFLNHRLLLRDGFFTYYLQSRFLSADDIPDVQTLVFDWPEDTEQWLLQCADFDHFTTFNNLRDFLSEEEIPFGLHLMDDSRVLLAAVRCITNERVPIVIQPNHGWAVKTDPNTGATTIPIVVEAAPDADSLINELRHELNALVAEQQKKYAGYEHRLSENNDFLEYSKAVGGGLYDFTESTVTSAIDAVKATYAVKQTLDNIATSFKIAAARSIFYGTLDPLKNQINAIVKPVSDTYEQALEYRAIITTLFNDEEIAELLTDFAKRYYKATHPLELTRFGVSGSGDIILTIILTITTAGVGAAANVALKVKRLEKIASILLKLAKILRRIGPRYRLPKLNKKTGISAKKAGKSATNKKKGIPDIESPKKKGDLVDGAGKKDYGDRTVADGPKKTTEPEKVPKKEPVKSIAEQDKDLSSVEGNKSEVLSGTAKKAKWAKAEQGLEGPGLRDHFQKHGEQVGAKTAKEYDLSSRKTIQNGREFTYRDRMSGELRVGYHDPDTGLFTATSQTRKTPAILSHFPETWKNLRKLPGFSVK